MGTSTGTLTFQGQRNFGSSYCLMQSLWMPEGSSFVCHTSSVFGLLARMTHHTTMAAEFQARHPRPHPPAEGKLSLMMASMREGGSFLVQYLDLCFIHILTAKSFMGGRGKKYLHSKAMGTHPQRVKTTSPTCTSWLQIWRVNFSKKNSKGDLGGRRES